MRACVRARACVCECVCVGVSIRVRVRKSAQDWTTRLPVCVLRCCEPIAEQLCFSWAAHALLEGPDMRWWPLLLGLLSAGPGYLQQHPVRDRGARAAGPPGAPPDGQCQVPPRDLLRRGQSPLPAGPPGTGERGQARNFGGERQLPDLQSQHMAWRAPADGFRPETCCAVSNHLSLQGRREQVRAVRGRQVKAMTTIKS